MTVIHEILETGPLQVNCHILAASGGQDALLIDPGGNAGEILRHLTRLGLRVAHIVNTHGHFDHVGAVHELKRALGCQFWLHEADRFLVESAPQHASRWGLPFGAVPEIDHPLTHGQRLELCGLQLEIIHTPGHTPGGVCIRWGDEIAVGDTLFAGGVGRTDLPGGDHEQLMHSIETRLMTLGDDVVCHPGHGASTTIGQERMGNPFLHD
ncbi:beta-lactamase domain protein [Magnetococcus marinus MC-1]|uniref:Beta-lactamase domain protein n=1 Tax=Magnetococcus marinus (strain ATCC BAA-1437 / JCM 17883 / MC-1) TaxID=156889 RepID=A0LDZ9_MAGMM|nr:MBL fold metallo-hydrolase [Magnetococcus marinus]ABK46192.1 beta-lactamase domain protein [Magnetococcus marinus MC-1]